MEEEMRNELLRRDANWWWLSNGHLNTLAKFSLIRRQQQLCQLSLLFNDWSQHGHCSMMIGIPIDLVCWLKESKMVGTAIRVIEACTRQ